MTTAESAPECLNCAAPLTGRYCAACGQKAGVDPSLSDIAHEVVHEFVHVDAKVVKSVRLLFTQPGVLTREYFLGRRSRYVSPLRLYLIFSVVFFAVSAYVGVPPAFTEDAKRGTVVNVGGVKISGDVFFKGRSKEEISERLREAQTQWPARLMFVLVPICGLLVMLVARKSGRNYPQHLWFALHLHAAYFGVMAFTAPIALIRQPAAGTVSSLLRIAFALWYSVTAFHAAYGGGWFTATRRALSVLVAYAVLIGFALAVLFATALLASTPSVLE